jgi:septum formation protein
MHVFLASQSPRRQNLLSLACITHSVVATRYDESSHTLKKNDPKFFALQQARLKGEGACPDLLHHPFPFHVLAADTIVALGNEILEKPVDAQDARRMLMSLSGVTHAVHTGLALFTVHSPTKIEVRDSVFTTLVTFRDLPQAEIESYIQSGEPFGRSGSYSVEDYGSSFIRHLEGSHTNVAGLPLAEVVEWLRNA